MIFVPDRSRARSGASVPPETEAQLLDRAIGRASPGACAWPDCRTVQSCGGSLERPRTARDALAATTGATQPAAAGHRLAARASRPDVTVWRAQPVVEVCAAAHYPAWRKARERASKRDGNRYSAQSWPERIAEGELAAVLLMQSHGGHRRGQPAEISVPGFAHGFPARGHDVEHPYEPLALALLVSWIKLALADERHAALLAPPLIDLIGRVPKPRIPRDLGINWPLERSEPHIRPRRR